MDNLICIIQKLNSLKNLSRTDLLYNLISERLLKSTNTYNKELSLYLNSYDFSIKSLKEINKNNEQ